MFIGVSSETSQTANPHGALAFWTGRVHVFFFVNHVNRLTMILNSNHTHKKGTKKGQTVGVFKADLTTLTAVHRQPLTGVISQPDITTCDLVQQLRSP